MLLFQGGDEEAFRELVRRFRDPIASFAFRLLDDYDRALDVAQETFVNVFTHAQDYRPMAGFSAWLYRIAYNVAINELRRQKRQPAFSLDASPHGDDDGAARFEIADEGISAEEEILARERGEAVRRGVASLPVKYRTAVVLKDMEGMTFEEIARILACPESTVKSRVMRARRMLATRLERYLGSAIARTGRTQPVRQGSG
jgi:RNA polymerase sigma-70 factor (ECF subfamily)